MQSMVAEVPGRQIVPYVPESDMKDGDDSQFTEVISDNSKKKRKKMDKQSNSAGNGTKHENSNVTNCFTRLYRNHKPYQK